MMENEIRAIVDDFRSLRERLRNLKARKLSKIEQTDTYFGMQNWQDKKFLLRIRTEDRGGHYLTYKGLTESPGVWREYEVRISEPLTLERILKACGFLKILTLVKIRESYKLADYEVNLDNIKGLGKFLEIQLISDKKEKHRLLELLEDLEIKQESVFHESYVSIALRRRNSTQ